MNDLILHQGTTFRRGGTYRNSGGAPIDLTNAVAKFQVHLGGPGGTMLIDLDNALKGGLTLGGASGTIALEIPAATSAAWTLPTTCQACGSEMQTDGTLETAIGALCTWELDCTPQAGDTVLLGKGNLIITPRGIR